MKNANVDIGSEPEIVFLPKNDLNVNEIYVSLQGEGTRTGLLTTFIRLQGCLLRCVWCDTPYALDRKETATMMKHDELINAIELAGSKLIMFTGGEPLEQEGVFSVIRELCDKDFEVTIETNGQADISKVDKRAVIIMDLKCPASKMEKKNNYKNLSYLKKTDEIKFVISDREDYDWAVAKVSELHLSEVVNTILFSPAFGILDEKLLAEWLIEDKIPVRMQLQTHKYIWEPDQRGV